MVFKAGQLAGSQQQVEGAGGTFRALRDMGSHGTVVTFADPDGNDFSGSHPERKVTRLTAQFPDLGELQAASQVPTSSIRCAPWPRHRNAVPQIQAMLPT